MKDLKQYETLGFCPVCEQSLLVTQLSCQCCKTQMNGQYRLNKFSYLPKELLVFTEVFLKNRGNIKEVERELGISYPTVRPNHSITRIPNDGNYFTDTWNFGSDWKRGNDSKGSDGTVKKIK